MDLISLERAASLSIEDVQGLYRQYVSASQVDLIGSFGFGRTLAQSAEGCVIRTVDGREILDMTGGIGVLNHGHNHPRILRARQRYAAERRMEVHKNFLSPWVAALSHNVAALLPGDLNISYFPNSGAEAVEGAVKMAYKYHGGRRKTVLHADISFHGKLLGAAGLTGSPELHFTYPTIPGIDAFTYNDIGSLDASIARHRDGDGCDVYAIVLEPLNASSMRACTEPFLRHVRSVCTANDIMLVFDEVYTGWGKTGTLFHFMKYEGLVPDAIVYAKSFGGGKASISGYTTSERVFRKAYDNLKDATLHSTTYYGFGEETATAIEAVNVIVEDDYPGRAREIERVLRPGLEGIAARHPDAIADVRGCGALYGIVFRVPRVLEIMSRFGTLVPSGFLKDPRIVNKVVTGAVISELFERHSVMTFYGSNLEIPLIVSPPLIAEEGQLRRVLDAIDQCCAEGMVTLVGKFLARKFGS